MTRGVAAHTQSLWDTSGTPPVCVQATVHK